MDEDFGPCGIGAEIAAQLADAASTSSMPRSAGSTARHSPTPYSPPLEAAVVPDVEAIAQAIRELCAE